MVDETISSSPDYNAYDAEDYSELAKSGAGESIRTFGANSGLLLALLIILGIGTIIYYLFLIFRHK